MASAVDIANMALSHHGSDTVIASLVPPDGSVEAGHCARFFKLARREAIEACRPFWAKARVALAPLPSNPSEVWSYAYALPSDCIAPLRVLAKSTVMDTPWWPFNQVLLVDEFQFFTERGSSDFEIEGGTLLTHEPEAVLLYLRDIEDTSKFPPTFTSGLSYLLAAYIAGPLIKGAEGVNAGRELRTMARTVLGEAAVSDANKSSERADFVPSHVRARY